MKLVSYCCDGNVSCGVLMGGGIVDIPSNFEGAGGPRSIKQILAKGESCLEQIARLADSAKEFIETDRVKFLAPIAQPGKILALAGNYAKHIAEIQRLDDVAESPRQTTTPRPFIMPATVIADPDAEIVMPCYSEEVDYEIELAVVIGRSAKCVSAEKAGEYIAGYTIANDISARSVTFKAGRVERKRDDFFDWLNGKWSDGFLPMGPCLVTADEIGDSQNLEMELTVNGHVRQKANTKDMIYTVGEVVSFLSHIMTLEAGDIIAMGTPEGVGKATDTFLQPGDKIRCAIERIGSLTNTIGKKTDHLYRPLV